MPDLELISRRWLKQAVQKTFQVQASFFVLRRAVSSLKFRSTKCFLLNKCCKRFLFQCCSHNTQCQASLASWWLQLMSEATCLRYAIYDLRQANCSTQATCPPTVIEITRTHWETDIPSEHLYTWKAVTLPLASEHSDLSSTSFHTVCVTKRVPFGHKYAPACNKSKKDKSTGATKVLCEQRRWQQQQQWHANTPPHCFVPPDRWQPASKVWLHSPQFERQTGTPGGRRGQRQRQKSRLVAHGQGKRQESHSTTGREQQRGEEDTFRSIVITISWRHHMASKQQLNCQGLPLPPQTPVTCPAFPACPPPKRYTAVHFRWEALALLSAHSAGMTIRYLLCRRN